MKHNVSGLDWHYAGRGLRLSVKPGTNGPCYRLERDIHSRTGRYYWEAWWCPEGAWSPERKRVFLARAHGHCLRAAWYAELHAATQLDDYYAQQLEDAP